MALFDLHEWLITALVVALITASLSPQSQSTQRGQFEVTAVCEKPGFPALGLVLSLH